jgi:hypothetical protein
MARPLRPLRILPLLALCLGTCPAEDATVAKSTVMRADRSLVSLKAGTVVEVVGRDDKSATVRYKGQTGTIPIGSLSPAGAAPAAPAAAAAAKPAAPVAKTTAPGSLVVDQPKSFYGNVVKKAETNAAKHEDNLVKPADDVMDSGPSK